MIEILYSLAGNFTVNTAVLSVPIVGIENLFVIDCLALTRNYFAARDNCTIETVSVSLPSCFSSVNLAGVSPLTARIRWQSTAGINYPMDELNGGGYGYFGIQCENQEIPLNVFVNHPAIVGNPGMSFIVKNIFGNISMVNVPIALNGVVFPIYLYVKIKHTINMITFP